MRRLFVSTVAVMMVLLGSTSIWADNQAEASRIAKSLNQAFPQYDIEVAYRDGNVRLRGTIQTPQDRDAITRYIHQIARVRSVSDQFTYSGPVVEQAAPVYQQPPMSGGLSPISSVPGQGGISPVSTLRANEPVYVAQLPAGNEGTYTESAQLGAPSIVAGDGAQMSIGQPYAAGYTAADTVSTDRMPMGTIVAGDGTVATQGGYQGFGNVPQGQPIVPGQNSQQPNLPNYSWPTTADYPNYSQVAYPKQYAAGAFPYIGPFYPYPQVPLGWRKVTMEWHDGYWWLDFNDGSTSGPFSPLFRQPNEYR